jgi:hypothetical protein
MKFEGTSYAEEIRTVDAHPATAKKMGQSRRIPLRSDWERVKEEVMMEALMAKFTQHGKLGSLLKATGNRLLVERTSNDRYWGDGGNYSGKNRLGYCLMRVRQQLNAATTTRSDTSAASTTDLPNPSHTSLEGTTPSVAPTGVEGTSTTEQTSLTLDEAQQDQAAARASHSRPMRKGKSKGQRKRSVYLDADGTPVFDKSSSTTVRVAGTEMNISSKALTPSARLVVHQFQHTKKREGIQSDAFDEDEEEEDEEWDQDDEAEDPHSITLGDFMSRKGASVPSHVAHTEDTKMEETIVSAQELIQLVLQIDASDPLAGELKQQLTAVLDTLRIWIDQDRLSPPLLERALPLIASAHSNS